MDRLRKFYSFCPKNNIILQVLNWKMKYTVRYYTWRKKRKKIKQFKYIYIWVYNEPPKETLINTAKILKSLGDPA